MKKILLAVFLASLMLLIPVASSIQTTNPMKNENSLTYYTETPKIYITEQEKSQIINFIEQTFTDSSEKNQAYDIFNDIIQPDLLVNTLELADAAMVYGYQVIPSSELNAVVTKEDLTDLLDQYWTEDNSLLENLFNQLIVFIIEIIKLRLGWINDLFEQGYYLFTEGVNILVQFFNFPVALLLAITSVVNEILAIPGSFANMLRMLFSREFNDFAEALTNLTTGFTSDMATLIDQLLDWVTSFPQIHDYLTEMQNFILWLDSEPWKNPVTISGQVYINGALYSGLTVTCRGQSTTTDGTGSFNLDVNIIPSEDSFPADKYYGMHNCSISVSEDGQVLKTTPALLSYSFSDGEVNWIFFIIKSKDKTYNLFDFVSERIQIFLQRISLLFPNLSI